MSDDQWFVTIDQHWAHFLECDIPTNAPDIQVASMKKAFAAGAISGLQLAIIAGCTGTIADKKAAIAKHAEAISRLGGMR